MHFLNVTFECNRLPRRTDTSWSMHNRQQGRPGRRDPLLSYPCWDRKDQAQLPRSFSAPVMLTMTTGQGQPVDRFLERYYHGAGFRGLFVGLSNPTSAVKGCLGCWIGVPALLVVAALQPQGWPQGEPSLRPSRRASSELPAPRPLRTISPASSCHPPPVATLAAPCVPLSGRRGGAGCAYLE